MKVISSPEARQDLRDIYLYLAAENPYAARALHERIKEKRLELLRVYHTARKWPEHFH
jgi:plasmid stabilization system protein ParE